MGLYLHLDTSLEFVKDENQNNHSNIEKAKNEDKMAFGQCLWITEYDHEIVRITTKR